MIRNLYDPDYFNSLTKKVNEIQLRNIEKINKEKQEARAISLENNALLRQIVENTDLIVKQMADTQKLLIAINSITKSNKDILNETLDHLIENKNINAELYSVLYKNSINSEEERIDVSSHLTYLLKDGVDITSGLVTILTALSGVN
ncbi:hypothetical protein [Macrococcus bovicus]|uniref:hypothetical protein n=1 Tax=Macrococcus bovicus TaxID=69968 RepID=UPI0025A503AB|nr:hypothetical protein [Macrococcus bovicus]WJP98446.1 hypothetical protein QSV55_03845 [Macrococcus bovicus]